MSSHVMSQRGVIHEVIEDDGYRMVLQNPSGSRITVTKSRDKFKPLESFPSVVWQYRPSMGTGREAQGHLLH